LTSFTIVSLGKGTPSVISYGPRLRRPALGPVQPLCQIRKRLGRNARAKSAAMVFDRTRRQEEGIRWSNASYQGV
jgi:hypothetical protein